MTIRDELLDIQQSSKDGVLHARAVVDWARKNPDSALYGALEWRNARAADQYRLTQVRQLIELHISFRSRDPVVVSLSIDRAGGGGYRSLADVAAAPNLRDILLKDALAELDRTRKKYERIVELQEVWAAAAEVAKRTGPPRKRGRPPREDRPSA